MKNKLIFHLLLAFVSFLILSFDLPKGWSPGGTDLKVYEMGIDPNGGRNGSSAATIKAISSKSERFGTMMQQISAEIYLNKRLRMTGYMRSKDVERNAGFWLRVDEASSGDPVAFDNMSDRAVKGTTEWTRYEIVLDVPSGASNIAFGALLAGNGQIWFDDIQFETVDNSIPVTGTFKKKIKNSEPVNLDFENK
jgi:hypothetical protein